MRKFIITICFVLLSCGYAEADNLGNFNFESTTSSETTTDDNSATTSFSDTSFGLGVTSATETDDQDEEKPTAIQSSTLNVFQNETFKLEKMEEGVAAGQKEQKEFAEEHLNNQEDEKEEEEVTLLSTELLFTPRVSVNNEMPGPNDEIIWSWEGNYDEETYRYKLDNAKEYTETSETSLTMKNDLEPGRHTLYVQEKYSKYWTHDGSATLVIFPIDVSGTDYLKGLPTSTAHTELLPLIIRFLISLGGLVAFMSFVYSGVWLIIFADHEEDVKNMKRNMIYSIVGLAIMGLAYSIVSGILKLF